MQRMAASETSERQLTSLERTPGRCNRDWWKDTDDTGTTPDTKSIAAAVEDGDTIELSAMAIGESPGNETVLVVDDEPLVREIVTIILRSLGYRVLEASGALEAQRLIGADKTINLMLTDFSMPETNGLELARWLQSKHPAVKVIITTGSLWELANQVGEQDRVAVLPKPFDGAQLGRMVQTVLG